MAIVEQVIIKVDIDADITGDLASIEARIKALEKRFADLDKAGGRAAGSVDDLTDSTKKLNKENDRLGNKFQKTKKFLDAFESGIKKLGSVLFSFMKTLAKISFIAMAAEVAVFTTALLGIKAALVGGRALVKGYEYAMTGLSVAAASVAAGLAVAAAAMRQYQEAQLIPLMGGGAAGRQKAAYLSRSYSSRTSGLYGSESMAAVNASLAGAGVRNGEAVASQLFNISGGDAKAAQSLAAQLESAKRSGNTSELVAALGQTRGFNAESIKPGASLESIIATISSGAGTADVYKNVANDMGNTFVGAIKTQFESIKSMFADAGVGLLGPFQEAFMQIANIIKGDLLSVFAVIRDFGSGSLAPSLVSFADAVSEFIRSNIVKHVSDISGTADKLRSFFGRMGDWYDRTKEWFKSYEAAANVVWDMVKAIFSSSEGGLFRSFSDLLVENRDAFVDFGSKIGDVITAIKQAFMMGNQGFFGMLDRLSATLTVVAESVIPAVADVMGAIAPMLDKIPDILRMVSDRLGPVLVNIAEAFQPVIDKLPNVVDGVLSIVEGMEPLIVGLAKAVELILEVLSLAGGAGNMAAGAGAMYLLGGGLKATGGGKGGLLSKALMGFFGATNRGAGRIVNRGGAAFAPPIPGTAIPANMAPPIPAAAKAGRFASLRAGARGGPMLGIGGAMAAYGGISQTYDEGLSFGSAASSIGGGAALGMAVAGPVGAAVGAIAGGIALGIAAWARDNKIEKAAAELANQFVSGIRGAFEGGEIKNGFTDEENLIVSDLVAKGQDALATSRMWSAENMIANNRMIDRQQLTSGIASAVEAEQAILAAMRDAVDAGNQGVGPQELEQAELDSYNKIMAMVEDAESQFSDSFEGQLLFDDELMRDKIVNTATNESKLAQVGDFASMVADTPVELLPDIVYDFDNDETRDYLQAVFDSGFLGDWEDGAYALENLDAIIDKFTDNPEDFIRMVDEQNAAFEEDQLRRKAIAGLFSSIGDELGVAGDVISDFVEEMGIVIHNAEDINRQSLQNLYTLMNAPILDQMKTFTLDLSNTPAAAGAAYESVVSAFNTLLQTDPTDLEAVLSNTEDYIDSFAQAHISAGGNPYTAYLGAVEFLQKAVASGELPAEIAEALNFDQLVSDNLGKIADESGQSQEELLKYYTEGIAATEYSPEEPWLPRIYGVEAVEFATERQQDLIKNAYDIFAGSGGIADADIGELQTMAGDERFQTMAADVIEKYGKTEEFADSAIFDPDGVSGTALKEGFQDIPSYIMTEIWRRLSSEQNMEVLGVNLSDVEDPTSVALAGVADQIRLHNDAVNAAAEAIKETPPPNTNFYIENQLQDRTGGSTALVTVTWNQTEQSD